MHNSEYPNLDALADRLEKLTGQLAIAIMAGTVALVALKHAGFI